MTDTPGIVITGGSGRMGQMLIDTVLASDACRLVGVVERAGHDWIGKDIGTARGQAAVGLRSGGGGGGRAAGGLRAGGRFESGTTWQKFY